jgi:pyruvate dehydrogenase (quinone)
MLMAEMSTCVKYQLPVKVIVIHNNTLGQIKWEQMVFLGNPEFGVELLSLLTMPPLLGHAALPGSP